MYSHSIRRASLCLVRFMISKGRYILYCEDLKRGVPGALFEISKICNPCFSPPNVKIYGLSGQEAILRMEP